MPERIKIGINLNQAIYLEHECPAHREPRRKQAHEASQLLECVVTATDVPYLVPKHRLKFQFVERLGGNSRNQDSPARGCRQKNWHLDCADFVALESHPRFSGGIDEGFTFPSHADQRFESLIE